MATLCLSMIVKNEEKLIRKCLESVKPYIDYWIIGIDVDSTDATEEIIHEVLHDIPGELHHDEWKGFGYNRTICIRRAASKADYVLRCDADFILEVEDEEFKSKLVGDSYLVDINGDYLLDVLHKSDLNWYYKGRTHECADSDSINADVICLEGIRYTTTYDGWNRAIKWERDLELLKLDLEDNPLDSRTNFYLGQTYDETGNYELAVEHFKTCAQYTHSPEEGYVALIRIARITQSSADYFQAIDYRPQRHEAYVELSKKYIEEHRYLMGYIISKIGIEIGRCEDTLFYQWDKENWILYDINSFSCWHVGKKEEGKNHLKYLLEGDIVPLSERERLENNLKTYDN